MVHEGGFEPRLIVKLKDREIKSGTEEEKEMFSILEKDREIAVTLPDKLMNELRTDPGTEESERKLFNKYVWYSVL